MDLLAIVEDAEQAATKVTLVAEERETVTVRQKDTCEAGIFLLTPEGWTLVARRKYADPNAAMRWVKSRTDSLQRQFPSYRVRGTILEIVDWHNLDMVLADYEQKRKAGDPEFSLQPAVTVITEGAVPPPKMTHRQGQFLAFIHYYTKIHGLPPAELDIALYFRISPPAAHEMIVTLERKGFIERVPGAARSIRLRVPREQLPDLE